MAMQATATISLSEKRNCYDCVYSSLEAVLQPGCRKSCKPIGEILVCLKGKKDGPISAQEAQTGCGAHRYDAMNGDVLDGYGFGPSIPEVALGLCKSIPLPGDEA